MTNNGGEDYFSKLYEESIKRQKKLEESKLIKDKKELEECTFKPKLLARSKSQSSLKQGYNDFLIFKKKLNERNEKIKRLKDEKESIINSSCTFEPSINKNFYAKTQSMNFFERVKHFKVNKQKKIHQLSQEYNTNDQNLSHGRLNRSNSFSYSSFKDRVTISTVERHKKLLKLEENLIREKGLTFKPKLNEDKLKSINSSFFERNKQFVDNKTVKIKSAVSQQELECTFSPKINENSENIILRKEESLEIPRSSSTVDRLYKYNKIYDQKKEDLRDSLKETFSFKPQISKNTELILKNREEYIKKINKNCEKNYEKRVKNLSQDSIAKEKIEENKNDNAQASLSVLKEESKELKGKNNSIDIIDSSKLNRTTSKNQSISGKSSDKLSVSRQQDVNFSKENKQQYKQQHPLEKMSDNQLLALANDYITTDESLDQFKKSGKSFNNLEKNYKISQNLNKKTSHFSDTKSASLSSRKMSNKQLNNYKDYKVPKNIEKALEYYNMVQS